MNDALVLSFGTSTLMAVPAIHYRLFFAHAVNRLCADSASRPKAIAVELGPKKAAYLSCWLRELNAGKKQLPVMLAAMVKNNLIRPSLRGKAIRLQEQTGKDLSELPPELLRRELDFCSEALLPLSSTDSIIEGIRSAIEHDIPVYGIDLEDSAYDDHKSIVFKQPSFRNSLKEYVSGNDVLAAKIPFGESDIKREFAMAARLKTLLQRHKSVLFTCGMAHWLRIRKLLNDPGIRPAPAELSEGIPAGKYQRVVVNPCMAVRFLDLFPVLAFAWEKARPTKTLDASPPDLDELLRGILGKSYTEYFNLDHKSEVTTKTGIVSMESSRHFERYLRNLALLEHCTVPDMFMTISTAREMLNSEFMEVLVKVFMDHPWADPKNFPNYGYLSETNWDDGAMLLRTSTGSKLIHVRLDSPTCDSVPLNYVMHKNNESTEGENLLNRSIFSWLPWDRLVTTSSIKAIAISQRRKDNRTAALESSIMDGLDIKATLRSRSRGEKKIYVKEQFLERIAPEEYLDGFPVVWIFSVERHIEDHWTSQVFIKNQIRRHIRNMQRFDRIVGDSSIIPFIGYGHKEPGINEHEMSYDRYNGMLVYNPTCFTNQQHARWLELTNYQRLPISRDGFFGSYHEGLHAMFRKRYGIDITQHHWITSLILFALPFAARAISVVAPDGYRLDEFVINQASKLNVSIYQTRLSCFSPAILDRMTRCHFAPCITLEPVCLYSRETEKLIGESQHAYEDLVPRHVLNFGNDVL
jgi:hypothetical protein